MTWASKKVPGTRRTAAGSYNDPFGCFSAGIARKLLGSPGIADDVYRALRDRKCDLFCPKCGGRGTVEETIYETKHLPAKREGIFIRPAQTVEVPVKTIRVACPACNGGRIIANPGSSYDALCEVVSSLVNLDHNCWDAGDAWDCGCDALEKVAFNDVICAAAMNAQAESVFADPGSNRGKPVLFFGSVSEIRAAGDFFLLLMNAPDRPAVVLYRGAAEGLKAAPCQVTGIISGVCGSTPLVLAATVTPVHAPHRSYKSSRPRLRVPRRTSAKTSSQKVKKSSPATDLLRTAKMYAQGKMRTNAIKKLRELMKKYPKSEQVEEAQAMLKALEAED